MSSLWCKIERQILFWFVDSVNDSKKYTNVAMHKQIKIILKDLLYFEEKEGFLSILNKNFSQKYLLVQENF